MKPETMHIEEQRGGGYVVTDDDKHHYIRKATLKEASNALIALWIEFNLDGPADKTYHPARHL